MPRAASFDHHGDGGSNRSIGPRASAPWRPVAPAFTRCLPSQTLEKGRARRRKPCPLRGPCSHVTRRDDGTHCRTLVRPFTTVVQQ
jgi:hypothetical protein